MEVTSLCDEILAPVLTANSYIPVTSRRSCFAYSFTIWSPWRVPRRIRGIIWSVHHGLCVYLGSRMRVGDRVQSRGVRAQLSVCIHDVCGLYTQGGETTFFHVRIYLITTGMMVVCHIKVHKIGCVLKYSRFLFYSCNFELLWVYSVLWLNR